VSRNTAYVPDVLFRLLTASLRLSNECFSSLLSLKTYFQYWHYTDQCDADFGGEPPILSRASWDGVSAWANPPTTPDEEMTVLTLSFLRRVRSELTSIAPVRICMVLPDSNEADLAISLASTADMDEHHCLAKLRPYDDRLGIQIYSFPE
jgi:hypothetical protein